jgi:hypothetical protein
VNDYAEVYPQQFPLEFESGVPNPARFPPAPDELVAFVRQYLRGLSRISIKIWHGRKRYSQLNAVIVGAEHDQLPNASVDQIVRAIMAVAQDYYEGIDQPCKFMAQALVYVKATGDPVKKASHFELGSAENVAAPEHQDDMLFGHIRECHREILDQAKIISEIGREAIKNAGQVFQAKQEALDAQAAANAVVLDSRRDEASERAREKKWERGFKMLEKAINTGIAQAVVEKHTGVHLPLPPGATHAAATPLPGNAANTPAITAPVTPTPAWAAAAQGGTSVGVTKPPPPKSEPDTAGDNEDDDLDESYADQGRKLYASITASQWPDLFEALTKAQVKLLRALEDPTDDATVLRTTAKFRGGLKDAVMARLAQVLTVEQIAAVIGLAGAAETELEDD